MTVNFKFRALLLQPAGGRYARERAGSDSTEPLPGSSELPPGVRSLADMPLHETVTVVGVAGDRRFRRRLLEMGLTPGVAVRVINIAPLGDPLEIEARASRLSIRRSEAEKVEVRT